MTVHGQAATTMRSTRPSDHLAFYADRVDAIEQQRALAWGPAAGIRQSTISAQVRGWSLPCPQFAALTVVNFRRISPLRFA
jgi:hypothetical protein